jgi:hypothetical protein
MECPRLERLIQDEQENVQKVYELLRYSNRDLPDALQEVSDLFTRLRPVGGDEFSNVQEENPFLEIADARGLKCPELASLIERSPAGSEAPDIEEARGHLEKRQARIARFRLWQLMARSYRWACMDLRRGRCTGALGHSRMMVEARWL